MSLTQRLGKRGRFAKVSQDHTEASVRGNPPESHNGTGMLTSINREILADFYTVSRSHLYWGRKPFNGLQHILEGLGAGEIFLDPFCGAGTPIITALKKGARVIASDLNPMAVFLSRVLVQPVSLFSLRQCFETIREAVAEHILARYAINCPKCRRQIYFDYLQWNSENGKDVPQAVKFTCTYCGLRKLHPLTQEEAARQIGLSKAQPEFWFPKKQIQTQRKPRVDCFHELFTGRNLSALSELYNAISGISSSGTRQNFQYTFTAMLYSCSQMQMLSNKSPSSSRGWTAPRFYLPPARMEKNVWKVFEVRFRNVLNCKARLNQELGAIRVSDSLERFETLADDVCIQQADYLSFPFPQKLKVSHVYIDPPCNDDVDYIGFSEFWGSWLGMKFPIQTSWRPGVLSLEENAEQIHKLLSRIRKNTRPFCNVTLAYGSKRRKAWPLVKKAILEAGYQIEDKSPILFDNSQKRKPNEFGSPDLYLVLKRTTKSAAASDKVFYDKSSDISTSERRELESFFKVSAFLLSFAYAKKLPSAERIREGANQLIRPILREKLSFIKRSDIIEWTRDNQTNQKAYNTLCLSFLDQILSMDGFRIAFAKKDAFDVPVLSSSLDPTTLPVPEETEDGADFVATDKNSRRLIFCFFEKGKERIYRKIAKRVLQQDQDSFRFTHFLIFPRDDEMSKYRQVGFADYWPRGFLLTFAEIIKRLTVLDPDHCAHFSLFLEKAISDFRSRQKIGHFTAVVEHNLPVQKGEDCKHFRIKFRAPELSYVVPGQFVMVDTLPVRQRKRTENRKALPIRKFPSYARITDLSPISYLKRPFSIHRAFYQHFKFGYLRNIHLPPNLAPVTHTIFPNRFEIFYKVLDDGIGTKELTKINKGDKIEMFGPLGRTAGLAGLRSKGITEVHLVGGSVGMAPLIFFGQALRFYSFKVKAFIGIDRIETLLFSARFAPTFSEDRENAYVYMENLWNIGLDLDDIYVATEHEHGASTAFSRLEEKNCHVGFVSEQYAKYLDVRTSVSGVLVIACGPEPMLRAMHQITNQHDIPMKILMEKRMACGIGVCMSCVCRTKKGSSTQYSRVCTDGPLFDAEEIVWG